MRDSRPNRPLRALMAGFVLLLLFIFAAIGLAIRQQDASQWVAHTLAMENRVSSLLSLIQDAESGQHGYLLTGQTSFLDRYTQSTRRLPTELDAFGRQVSDNPVQVAALEKLRWLVAARLRDLSQGLERFRTTRRVDADMIAAGKISMDGIRLQIGTMRQEEERLLRARTETLQRLTRLALVARILTALGVLLFGGFAFANSRRQLLAAIRARDALAAANEQLRTESASRRQAEEQMRQLQKMEALGQLTGGIAHDFNNMLAVVVGSLDMAARRLGKGETQRAAACIDNALEGAQRATQLTARLLAFSRQQPLDPQPVDTNKLVGGMSEMLRRTIGEQLKVETVLAAGLWRTLVDPPQLENALLNLCVNARDAMPGGGRLTVETANTFLDDDYAEAAAVAPGQYVLISVTDSGIGMTPDVAARAFDPFYTTKGVGQGTGLGLSQVFGFVKQSRGHVKLYTEPGQGTSVKIYLPRFFGEGAAASPPAEAGSPDAPRGAKEDEVVLVVEDEDRVRHISVDALRELGYTVVQASDGNQALEMLAIQPRVDLLFTDVVMPGMNGRELADEVVKQRPQVKVLFTTGYTRNAIVHNGMLDPGVAFLPKPFTIEQLAAKVRQVLDREDQASGKAALGKPPHASS